MGIDFGKRLGMGCLRLPVYDENKQAEIDMDAAQKIIDLFMEQGYNYFDTSWIYHSGNSEAALGKLLVDRYPRDSFLISTKMPLKFMKKKEEMEDVFRQQLDRCHLAYFDFYLIHAIMRDTYELCKKWGVWEFLRQKRAEGRFREFGVSLHDTPEFLDEILTEHPEIDFVILQINYVDWDNEVIRARESYEVAVRHDVPIVVMEACKGGTLACVPEEAETLMKAYNPNASVASWAFRFVGGLPGVRVVLAGMPKMEFLLDNLKVFNDFKPLNEEEHKILKRVCEIINENTAIPCTTCRYCEPECPKQIPIPDYFNLYNDMKRFEKTSNPNRVNIQANYYESFIKGGRGAAGSCIGCKICEKVCPQGLPVVKYLKEYIKAELEDYEHRS
ncbi:MAG: aldo/keto reductase [Clostridiales Family XIII bacterium]|jgi:predicted aldo/keto reductase-like oxidoreductase|nr:aldo/keto reductase [Clostridiales Family XIII bacterium]